MDDRNQVYFESCLRRAPKRRKKNGMGTKTAAKQPSRVLAHCTPIFENICRVKRGKLEAKADRRMMLAATADAALYINSVCEWCLLPMKNEGSAYTGK